MKKKKLVALQLDEDLKLTLKREGEKMGLSLSAYIRYLLINRK